MDSAAPFIAGIVVLGIISFIIDLIAIFIIIDFFNNRK